MHIVGNDRLLVWIQSDAKLDRLRIFLRKRIGLQCYVPARPTPEVFKDADLDRFFLVVA